MTNVNELTQLTNQEAILEEINEEELDGVVGGFVFLGPVLGALGTGLDNTLTNALVILGSLGG
ncbi:MAG: hypothetical protein RMY64_07930 [Nostoc sp. DedQUE08]|uniref:hypothetical protein n=1 Tax=Nostoc sp. DedQUE08 TaxID=3075393 RepID=UPI002AD4B65D|nr:hypothetical protein [Nostoc sp. DedQUE08]MDZ8065556.1 hypothetical protein [Nostoc sp. DedQUE08]